MNTGRLLYRCPGAAARFGVDTGRSAEISNKAMRPKRRAITALVLAALVFPGCAQNYGRFAIDRQVAQDFRAGVVRPEYQYYYSGRDTMPYAIIAIHRTWRVPSHYWTPFAPEPGQLMRMSGNIYDEVQKSPYGASIKTPTGETIGLWFSNVFNRSVRVDPEQRTVEILFTNPENDDRPAW